MQLIGYTLRKTTKRQFVVGLVCALECGVFYVGMVRCVKKLMLCAVLGAFSFAVLLGCSGFYAEFLNEIYIGKVLSSEDVSGRLEKIAIIFFPQLGLNEKSRSK